MVAEMALMNHNFLRLENRGRSFGQSFQRRNEGEMEELSHERDEDVKINLNINMNREDGEQISSGNLYIPKVNVIF